MLPESETLNKTPSHSLKAVNGKAAPVHKHHDVKSVVAKLNEFLTSVLHGVMWSTSTFCVFISRTNRVGHWAGIGDSL
jgi:hypothetical protein